MSALQVALAILGLAVACLAIVGGWLANDARIRAWQEGEQVRQELVRALFEELGQ